MKMGTKITAREHPKTRPEFFLDVEEGLFHLAGTFADGAGDGEPAVAASFWDRAGEDTE